MAVKIIFLLGRADTGFKSSLVKINFKNSNMLLKKIYSYKFAPEHPYPSQANECYSVAKYVLNNPDEFGADGDRIVFAGDSAGNIIYYHCCCCLVFCPKAGSLF